LYYFFHFLLLLPILGRTERTLPLPTSILEPVTKHGAGAGK
jgi:ubiquinol-cytochrome c reductase cytochrome b/c1 subunit